MSVSSGRRIARAALSAVTVLIFLLAPSPGPALSQPSYTYDSFHVEIEVSGDGTVLVRDKVTYSLQDDGGWVGISVPSSYGTATEARVLAGDGTELPPERWERDNDDSGLTVWCLVEGMGPSATVIYEYRLRGALQRDWERVGLRDWSAVPTQRSSPIGHTSVTIRLPEGLDGPEIETRVTPYSYSGDVSARVQGNSTVIIEADWLDASSSYSFDCFWPSRVMDTGGSGFSEAQEKSWEFERFDVDITLHPDSTFTVRETQVVNFHGGFSWLARDLSTQSASYGEGRTYGRVRARDIAVYNLDGTPYDEGAWRVEDYAGGRTVRIEFEARDEQRGWMIEYRMSGALVFAGEHDRLYWNAVSVDRDVPIRSSAITVHLPPGVDTGAVDSTQYVDIYNPPSTYETSAEGNELRWTVRDIAPGTTFTIDVALPKGAVGVPWPYGRACGIAVISSSGALFAAVLFLMLILWWRRGRDVGRTGTAMVRYDPPEGLTPAMVGTLVRERPRVEDISATIVDLARRGYLKIIELERRSLIRMTDYAFQRLKGEDEGLRPYERETLEGLFSAGDYVEEKDLRDRFYVHVDPILKQGVRKEVMTMGLFDRDPDRVRGFYYAAGFMLALLPTAAALVLPRWIDLGWFSVLLFSFLPTGALVALVGRFMPRRSPEGSRLYEHVMGFREYMSTAEGEELESMTPETFQANLPYAMVLGVAEAWARKFMDIYTTPPEWFSSASSAYNAVYLTSSLNDMTGRLNSTLTSTPGSSGSGGSGGFGGGSSGGGFGGGGSSAG